MRRVRVGEELRDNGRLGDDFAVVGDGGDETAGVDLQVFGGAGDAEVDDFFFEGEIELGEGDMSSVCPWLAKEELGISWLNSL